MDISTRLFFCAAVTLLISVPAFAVLGARPIGKQVGTQEFSAQAVGAEQTVTTTSTQDKFQIYASTSANGSAIKEYVNNNLVFAVSWSGGNTHPDLGQLLGSDFAAYQTGLESQPKKKGRGAHKVVADDLVVVKSGHMFDNRGLAYKKSLLPAGVTPADLH